MESLTRLFNTEVIACDEFADIAKTMDIPFRRLGRFNVKGRIDPSMLYALGRRDDERFSVENIANWEKWLTELEKGTLPDLPCPKIHEKDRMTLTKWFERNLLKSDGVSIFQ